MLAAVRALDTAENQLARLLSVACEHPDRVRDVCSEITDWEAVANAAGTHDVAAYVEHYVEGAGIDVGSAGFSRLRQISFLQRVRLRPIGPFLREILDLFEDNGIRAVSLKGPVLASRLYPDTAMRPSFDVDVLVDPENLDRAVEVLSKQGYEFDDEAGDAYHRRHHHHLHAVHRDKPFMVELHFHAFAGFATTIPATPLIERSVQYEFEGRPVRVLAPEDEVLYLVAHQVGHFAVQLKWLLDLKLLVAKYPRLDWDSVCAMAAEYGLSRALGFGLFDLARTLDVHVPMPRSLAPTARVVRYVDAARRAATNGQAGRSAVTFGSLFASALLCDGASRSIRFVSHHISHLAKRRTHRLLPAVTPGAWAG